MPNKRLKRDRQRMHEQAKWNRLIAEKSLRETSSVECPCCHWGFAPTVIDQHIREKHDNHTA